MGGWEVATFGYAFYIYLASVEKTRLAATSVITVK